MFEHDDDSFPIKCPSCAKEFYEKVGRIKSGLDSICPDCGLRITHPAEQFKRLLQDAHKALPDYLRRFVQLDVLK